MIKPLMQAAIGRQNPVTGEWKLRSAASSTSFNYRFDPSQNLNWLTISLVDLFELLAAAEMQPGIFGVRYVVPGELAADPPPARRGRSGSRTQPVEERFAMLLAGFGLPRKFWCRVPVQRRPCRRRCTAPASRPLTVLQEAADAEIPGANVFCDRFGRALFPRPLRPLLPRHVRRQRRARTRGTTTNGRPATGPPSTGRSSDTVQMREFAFDRGLSRLINSATVTPAGIDDDQAAGQLVTEPEAVGYYGVRSYSADGLLTKYSLLDGATALEEARNFAHYIVVNFKWLRDRITAITFRPLHPDDPRAPALYEFLGSVDIGDTVSITIASPAAAATSSTPTSSRASTNRSALAPTTTTSLSPWICRRPADYDTNPWRHRRVTTRPRPHVHARDHEHGGADADQDSLRGRRRHGAGGGGSCSTRSRRTATGCTSKPTGSTRVPATPVSSSTPSTTTSSLDRRRRRDQVLRPRHRLVRRP